MSVCEPRWNSDDGIFNFFSEKSFSGCEKGTKEDGCDFVWGEIAVYWDRLGSGSRNVGCGGSVEIGSAICESASRSDGEWTRSGLEDGDLVSGCVW